MQIINVLLLETVILQDIFRDLSSTLFCYLSNWWNVRKKGREEYKGLERLTKTASDKMSMAPELNPGD